MTDRPNDIWFVVEPTNQPANRALELRGSVTLEDTVAYRGSVRSEKEFPRVDWIIGKLPTRSEGGVEVVIEVQ